MTDFSYVILLLQVKQQQQILFKIRIRISLINLLQVPTGEHF